MLICFSSLTNFHIFLPLYFLVCRKKRDSKLASFISVLKHPIYYPSWNSIFRKSSSASRDALNYRKTKKEKKAESRRFAPLPLRDRQSCLLPPESRNPKKTLGKTTHSEHFCILFCNCDCISIFFQSALLAKKHRFAISDNDECISLLFGWFTGPRKKNKRHIEKLWNDFII